MIKVLEVELTKGTKMNMVKAVLWIPLNRGTPGGGIQLTGTSVARDMEIPEAVLSFGVRGRFSLRLNRQKIYTLVVDVCEWVEGSSSINITFKPIPEEEFKGDFSLWEHSF